MTEEIVKNSESVPSSGSNGSGPQQEAPRQIFPIPLSQLKKPEKFNGSDFKTWQPKMLFFLTMSSLAHYVKDDPPTYKDDEEDITIKMKIDSWKNSDYLCQNLIMNGLTDALYRVYSTTKTEKELWTSLERKFKTEDAGAKKFLVAQFLHFTMIDCKTVVSQVQQLQLIIQGILAEKMMIHERFQVASIIKKLPPSWKDFKNYLMHKRKEMSVEDMIVRLRIEEDNRGAAKKFSHVADQSMARVNMVEAKRGKKTQDGPNLGSRRSIAKKPKFTGKCYNCNEFGHTSFDCMATEKDQLE